MFLKCGADILKEAPAAYSSTVEYPDNAIAESLKGVAQVHFADLGTQYALALGWARRHRPVRIDARPRRRWRAWMRKKQRQEVA